MTATADKDVKEESKNSSSPLIDGKQLISLFKSMSVRSTKASKQNAIAASDKRKVKKRQEANASASSRRRSSSSSSAVRDKWRDLSLKALAAKSKSSFKKSSPPKTKSVFKLRPSQLTAALEVDKKDKSAEARFSEFSAACCKELESIEKTSKSKKAAKKTQVENENPKALEAASEPNHDQVKTKKKAQKRRKQSSCAEQARAISSSEYNHNTPHDINLDVDLLADYLEESILIPKKMSYMAELMYT